MYLCKGQEWSSLLSVLKNVDGFLTSELTDRFLTAELTDRFLADRPLNASISLTLPVKFSNVGNLAVLYICEIKIYRIFIAV